MSVKRKKKNGVIIAGVLLIIIGIACVVSVLAINNWNFSSISARPTLTEMKFVADKMHHRVNIEEDSSNIIIKSTDDEFINVTYYESEKQSYSISSNEQLTIEKTTNLEWYHKMGMFSFIHEVPMVVSIPKSLKCNIDIKVDNGKITIVDAMLENVKISNDNGSINIRNSSFNSLTTIVGNGKTDMKNVTSTGEIDIKNNNGKIDLDYVKSASKIIIFSQNGSIELDNIESDELVVAGNNGSIDIDNAVAITRIEVVGSTGAIEVYNAKTKDIIIRSDNGVIEFERLNVSSSIEIFASNGKVDGDIIGKKKDFNIISEIQHGISNIPTKQTGGHINLTVIVKNGFIDIDFIG